MLLLLLTSRSGGSSEASVVRQPMAPEGREDNNADDDGQAPADPTGAATAMPAALELLLSVYAVLPVSTEQGETWVSGSAEEAAERDRDTRCASSVEGEQMLALPTSEGEGIRCSGFNLGDGVHADPAPAGDDCIGNKVSPSSHLPGQNDAGPAGESKVTCGNTPAHERGDEGLLLSTVRHGKPLHGSAAVPRPAAEPGMEAAPAAENLESMSPWGNGPHSGTARTDSVAGKPVQASHAAASERATEQFRTKVDRPFPLMTEHGRSEAPENQGDPEGVLSSAAANRSRHRGANPEEAEGSHRESGKKPAQFPIPGLRLHARHLTPQVRAVHGMDWKGTRLLSWAGRSTRRQRRPRTQARLLRPP